MLGSIISGIGNIVGGFMSRDAQQDANAQAARQAQLNRDMQEQFAKQGIRWKVNDARQAGIHPLYALGAQTTSYSPVTAGYTPETGLAAGLANASQDIGRAIDSTRTQPERANAYTQAVQSLTLKNMELDTEIKRTDLASRVARLNQTPTPPTPAIAAGPAGMIGEDLKPDERPVGLAGGTRLWTDPNSSNVDEFWTKRYGEPGEWVGAGVVGWNDLMHNFKNMSVVDMLKYIDKATSINRFYGRR